jgi:hypothetical protein
VKLFLVTMYFSFLYPNFQILQSKYIIVRSQLFINNSVCHCNNKWNYSYNVEIVNNRDPLKQEHFVIRVLFINETETKREKKTDLTFA